MNLFLNLPHFQDILNPTEVKNIVSKSKSKKTQQFIQEKVNNNIQIRTPTSKTLMSTYFNIFFYFYFFGIGIAKIVFVDWEGVVADAGGL